MKLVIEIREVGSSTVGAGILEREGSANSALAAGFQVALSVFPGAL